MSGASRSVRGAIVIRRADKQFGQSRKSFGERRAAEGVGVLRNAHAATWCMHVAAWRTASCAKF